MLKLGGMNLEVEAEWKCSCLGFGARECRADNQLFYKLPWPLLLGLFVRSIGSTGGIIANTFWMLVETPACRKGDIGCAVYEKPQVPQIVRKHRITRYAKNEVPRGSSSSERTQIRNTIYKLYIRLSDK